MHSESQISNLVSPLRIVSRDAHSISRKAISPNALRVLYRLRDSGFAAFLVGGAVRDLLLGGRPKDFDIATDATPDQVRSLFRNCRLIGRRFRLAHIVYGPEVIEVATFRANIDDGSGDREMNDGRLVRDNVFGNIEDDAVRRDFTANALYYSIADFSVHDYVGGVADVEAHCLRLIGSPEQRYREDPVRMLRAVRLAAKLGFHIEAEAAAAIPRMAELLSQASSARLFDETLKLFLTGHAAASFSALREHGLLAALFADTAAALAADGSGLCLALIDNALRSTDARVQAMRPVTPVFLLAALLWPAYAAEVAKLLDQGHGMPVAEQRGADRVLVRQTERVGIPRRFAQSIEELWRMQSRFAARQRKRMQRLLAHPRFRAAFDLLELRASVVPELQAELQFWRDAQRDAGVDGETLAPAPIEASDDPASVPGKRPRRRRRRSESSAE